MREEILILSERKAPYVPELFCSKITISDPMYLTRETKDYKLSEEFDKPCGAALNFSELSITATLDDGRTFKEKKCLMTLCISPDGEEESILCSVTEEYSAKNFHNVHALGTYPLASDTGGFVMQVDDGEPLTIRTNEDGIYGSYIENNNTFLIMIEFDLGRNNFWEITDEIIGIFKERPERLPPDPEKGYIDFDGEER